MRNINLTKDEFIEKLNKYLSDHNFDYNISETTKSDRNWIYDITIAGNLPFKYAIFDTPRALSVVPQGQNQKMANDILKIITSDAPIVEHKSQSFVGIIPSVYNKVKEYYNIQEEYVVNEIICNTTQTNLVITKNQQKVTFQYYPTTHKAILAGQSTYLWNEVSVELMSHLNLNAKDIVSL